MKIIACMHRHRVECEKWMQELWKQLLLCCECCARVSDAIFHHSFHIIDFPLFPPLSHCATLLHSSTTTFFKLKLAFGISIVTFLRFADGSTNKKNSPLSSSSPLLMRLLWKHSFLASTRCDNSAVDMMNHTMANVNPPFKLNLRANISVWIIYEQKWKDESFDSNRSSTPTFTSRHEMLEFSWIAAELWRKDKVFTQHKKQQT